MASLLIFTIVCALPVAIVCAAGLLAHVWHGTFNRRIRP